MRPTIFDGGKVRAFGCLLLLVVGVAWCLTACSGETTEKTTPLNSIEYTAITTNHVSIATAAFAT
eukprot:scaffold14329_cov200-Alexandrium_tamarense.AAC.3